MQDMKFRTRYFCVALKNCACKLRMKIANRNCGWSALGSLDAGAQLHSITSLYGME